MNITNFFRGVAQPGSAPGLGPGGRRFESFLPDHYLIFFFKIIIFALVKLNGFETNIWQHESSNNK